MSERRRFGTGTAARLVATLALALTASSCTPLDDALAAVFGRSMRDQPSFDPYENPRMPAEGAVPFASGNYPAEMGTLNLGQPVAGEYDLPSFTSTPADLMSIAAPLPNPVPATPESLERGKLMFDRYCAICHGPNGLSAEAPILEKHQVMVAFNLAIGPATTYTDGYIYGIMRVGRGLMPAYGHQVTHFDRWHIVNYVRQLQAGSGGEN
jgi:mono/diheme cytochrome c family protein